MMRPWACDLHRGESLPTKATHFEIGLSRTGSRSLYVAARKLGVNACHGFGSCKVCENDAIVKHMRGRIDFDVYRAYDYCGQVAGIHWRRLSKADPDAKFILPVRPMDDWLKSIKRHMRKAMETRRRDPWFALEFKKIYETEWELCKHAGDDFWALMRTTYELEISKVLNPQNRLTVINVFEESNEELWEKMADFIGVSRDKIPDEPFQNRTKPIKLYRYENLFLER